MSRRSRPPHEDLHEVVKLMVDELEGHRQRCHEKNLPAGN